MKLPFKERIFLSTVVFALTVVLIALAVLQYHWSQQVSAATSTRLHENLDSSMLSWREDLNRELTSIFSTLQADPSLPLRDKAQQYTQQYQTWSQTAAHANVVAHIFLLQDLHSDHPELFQLNSTAGRLEPADWPAELDQLHKLIQDRKSDEPNPFRRREFHVERMGPGPFPNHRFPTLDIWPLGIDTNAMALVRMQVHPELRQTKEGVRVQPNADLLIVQLDRQVLLDHTLPEITEHHFSGNQGLDYQVALVSSPGSVIYSTDPGFGSQDTASLDGKMPVFGPPRNPPPRKNINGASGPPPHHGGPRHDHLPFGFSGPTRLEPIQYSNSNSDWQLLVRHRQGSLEAVVTRLRHRNLAISFGVLLVLAAGIAIIVVSSQRARILARLQMDFVAAVSHELRTPLAVISSAAENIADGVVAGKQQLTEYGTEIKNQAKQLMQLVEQILLFAATRDSRHQYNVRPLKVADVIDAALKDTAALVEGAGITVEQQIAANLPPISGDLSALSHCLQNLITNAVKYGGDARWIGIQAEVCELPGRTREVQISVEDRGLGIEAADLQRIFEPFYRSSSVAAAQIHGTGLGLPLARDIAEAMGGSLTVASEPGKGSRFTLHLRVADAVEVPVGAPATVRPNLS